MLESWRPIVGARVAVPPRAQTQLLKGMSQRTRRVQVMTPVGDERMMPVELRGRQAQKLLRGPGDRLQDRLLTEHDRDVSDLAANLGISMASTSHHLGRLRRAGLVISRRHGTHITNRLAALDVTKITGAACAVVP